VIGRERPLGLGGTMRGGNKVKNKWKDKEKQSSYKKITQKTNALNIKS
jgi:hypothetical protein